MLCIHEKNNRNNRICSQICYLQISLYTIIRRQRSRCWQYIFYTCYKCCYL